MWFGEVTMCDKLSNSYLHLHATNSHQHRDLARKCLSNHRLLVWLRLVIFFTFLHKWFFKRNTKLLWKHALFTHMHLKPNFYNNIDYIITQSFPWESKAKLETFWKGSPYIGVSYKFFFKSMKNLNRIFWAMEYLFKAL